MLKIADEFILKEIAGETLVVVSGAKSLTLNAMLKLNESGTLLFKALKKGTTQDALVKLLLEQYDVSLNQAQTDVEAFIALLQKHHIL